MTKKEQFISSYNNLPLNTSRKDALEILSKECNLSPAGTSTYYSNVKSGKWSTTETPKEVKEVKEKIVKVKEVKSVHGVISTHPESVTVVDGIKIVEDKGLTIVNGKSLDEMSGPELVTLFNSHVKDVTKHVNKFRTKADGIKRIVNMLCE